jgi:hypothetical protein
MKSDLFENYIKDKNNLIKFLKKEKMGHMEKIENY